jgi:hypothetical protein
VLDVVETDKVDVVVSPGPSVVVEANGVVSTESVVCGFDAVEGPVSVDSSVHAGKAMRSNAEPTEERRITRTHNSLLATAQHVEGRRTRPELPK